MVCWHVGGPARRGRNDLAAATRPDRVAVPLGPALRDETRPALVPGVTAEELTPRNVQAFFTCQIAARMGGGLAVDEGAGGAVAFTARLGG